MTKSKTHYVRGKAFWARVFGEPRLNELYGHREHTIEVVLDADGIAKFKELKLADRLKDSKQIKGKYYQFKQKEFQSDGVTKNQPIKVVDANNNPWPDKKYIGNESVVDIKFNHVPANGPKKAGVYIKAIRVLEHVPFEVQEFAPLTEDDEYFAGASSTETPDFEEDFGMEQDELDDDVPF